MFILNWFTFLSLSITPPQTENEGGVDFANRTPEKLDSLSKNATALRGRRGAVNRKQAETKDIKGHKFIKKFFRRPTYCSLCHEFLW